MIALRGGWHVMCWFFKWSNWNNKIKQEGILKRDRKYKSLSKNFLLCRIFILLSCHIQSICMGFDSQLSFPEINYIEWLCYRGSMGVGGRMEKVILEHVGRGAKMSLEPRKCDQDPLTSLTIADKQLIHKAFPLAYSAFLPELVVVQSLSHVPPFTISWTAARQVPLSSTVTWSLLRLMSIESVILSNHLTLCHPLLLLSLIFPSIRVSSDESPLCISWPKCWSFSPCPSSEYISEGKCSWSTF